MASGGQGPNSGQVSKKYNTPQKQECRNRLIEHAVECLTTGRATSTCVQRQQVREAWDAFENSEACRSFNDEEVRQMKDEINKWEDLHDSKTRKTKEPKDLHVCYLAGENLMNDLEVFTDCKVLGQNIWAIEKDSKEIHKVKEAVKESSKRIQVHAVFSDFINFMQDQYTEQFDIIYFDACSSLPSEKQETLKAIGSVFLNNKLASPGALITTFSFPPLVTENEDKKKETREEKEKRKEMEKKVKEEKENLTKLAKGYLQYRLKNTIGQHPSDFDSRTDEEHYSDYITYQVIDTAYRYIPALRMLSSNSRYSKSRWQQLFLEEKRTFKDLETIEKHSSSFLLQLWEHMIKCKDNPFCKSWFKELFPENPNNKPLKHFIITHLLPSSTDLHTIYSSKVKELLMTVCSDFFQVQNECVQETNNESSYCFAKMVMYLLYGQMASPSFVVPEKLLRFKYSSSRVSDSSHRKQMFSDVFIFDECKYSFNQLNSLDFAYKTIEDKIVNWIIKANINCLSKKLAFIYNDVFKCCESTTSDESMGIPKRENIRLLLLKREGEP